jgi:hypothetical protein
MFFFFKNKANICSYFQAAKVSSEEVVSEKQNAAAQGFFHLIMFSWTSEEVLWINFGFIYK